MKKNICIFLLFCSLSSMASPAVTSGAPTSKVHVMVKLQTTLSPDVMDELEYINFNNQNEVQDEQSNYSIPLLQFEVLCASILNADKIPLAWGSTDMHPGRIEAYNSAHSRCVSSYVIDYMNIRR